MENNIMDDNLIWSAFEIERFNKCLLVSPTKISNCGFLCSDKPCINKKCYIGFGEMCSICIEPIMLKKDAWLTPCGHQFHRKCLINNHRYRQINSMTIEYSNEIPCPICRTGLVNCCVGIDDMDKYNSKNGLDCLENFWLSIDNASYIICYNCDKGMGMNLSCKECEYYRQTGII
jgi:hypothetical protein